jgi:hypothetical protein
VLVVEEPPAPAALGAAVADELAPLSLAAAAVVAVPALASVGHIRPSRPNPNAVTAPVACSRT